MVKLTDPEFRMLTDYIKERYGINLDKKRVLVEGRMGGYLAERGYASYSAFLRNMMGDPSGTELRNLLDRLTTNHTYFMREPDHFDFFRDQLLPPLERNVKDRNLRIWCAGCSTGEEPYTLAMLLHDHFGGLPLRWNKQILATDLSTRVLETARLGIYPAQSIRTLPEHWQRRYFHRIEGDRFQAVPFLRQAVEYRQANLMDPIRFLLPYHAIFCRNVMIYFDAETKTKLVNRLYKALCPGGYLFVGHTEYITKPTPFEYVRPAVYRKGVER